MMHIEKLNAFRMYPIYSFCLLICKNLKSAIRLCLVKYFMMIFLSILNG